MVFFLKAFLCFLTITVLRQAWTFPTDSVIDSVLLPSACRLRTTKCVENNFKTNLAHMKNASLRVRNYQCKAVGCKCISVDFCPVQFKLSVICQKSTRQNQACGNESVCKGKHASTLCCFTTCSIAFRSNST